MSSVSNLGNCLSQIKQWTIENKLGINDGKAEVVHFLSNFFAKKLLQVSELVINQASVCHLSVLFDKHLNMKSHINNICKRVTITLSDISKIRRYLDTATTEQLVHDVITSVLDSCNSLLHALQNTEHDMLQHIPNSAARLAVRFHAIYVMLEKKSQRCL